MLSFWRSQVPCGLVSLHLIWRSEFPYGLVGLHPTMWRLLGVYISLPFPALVILISLTEFQYSSSSYMGPGDYIEHLNNPNSICTKGILINHTWTVPLSRKATHPWVLLVRTHRLLFTHLGTFSPLSLSFSILPTCARDGTQGLEHVINTLSLYFISSTQTCTFQGAKQITRQEVKLTSPFGHWNLLFKNPSP